MLLRARDTLNTAAAPATGFLRLHPAGRRRRRQPYKGPTRAGHARLGWRLRWGDNERRRASRWAPWRFPTALEARRFQMAIPMIVCALFALFLATSAWPRAASSVGNSALTRMDRDPGHGRQRLAGRLGGAAAAPAASAAVAASPLQLQGRRDLAFAVSLRHWLGPWRMSSSVGHRGSSDLDRGAAGCPVGLGLAVSGKKVGRRNPERARRRRAANALRPASAPARPWSAPCRPHPRCTCSPQHQGPQPRPADPRRGHRRLHRPLRHAIAQNKLRRTGPAGVRAAPRPRRSASSPGSASTGCSRHWR